MWLQHGLSPGSCPPPLSPARPLPGGDDLGSNVVPPETPAWLGRGLLEVGGAVQDHSPSTLGCSVLYLLLHQNTHGGATGPPARQEAEGARTTGSGWRERPRETGRMGRSRARHERRGKRKLGEKRKKGTEGREKGEDGLGSCCDGALACEQTSLWAQAPPRAHTHMCSDKPTYLTDVDPDWGAATSGVKLGWGARPGVWVGRVLEKVSWGRRLEGVREGPGRDRRWEPRAWAEAADVGFSGEWGLVGGSTLKSCPTEPPSLTLSGR